MNNYKEVEERHRLAVDAHHRFARQLITIDVAGLGALGYVFRDLGAELGWKMIAVPSGTFFAMSMALGIVSMFVGNSSLRVETTSPDELREILRRKEDRVLLILSLGLGFLLLGGALGFFATVTSV